MAGPWKILVADRNRHVRELLRRELSSAGYQVQVAKDGLEVWGILNGGERPDLLILDLEIPFLEELKELAGLKESEPLLPMVVFSFLGDYPHGCPVPQAAAFLEKTEDTDRLKAVVAKVLNKYYAETLEKN